MKFFLKNSRSALILASSLIFSAGLYAQEALQDARQDGVNEKTVAPESAADESKPRKAENINLQDVIIELEPATSPSESEPVKPAPEPKVDETFTPNSFAPETPNQLVPAPEPAVEEKPAAEPEAKSETPGSPAATPSEPATATVPDSTPQAEQPPVIPARVILGVEVPPSTSTRLVWTPEDVVSGLAERTPVLVVNGKNPGKTLCLTGAVHGDELNGIEMIRRIMYQLKPEELTGTVIGVPVVNLMGFRRNSRYLPDRRDLNRYFPGNTHGSSASRIAHSFFTNIIRHCDALVDIHTGSFHRTNLTQLRADLSNESVAELAQSFGVIAVLNSRGNSGSLRAAAVRAGIPSVTVEAGEPMRMQSDVVAEGTKAVETLLSKMGMYGRNSKWTRQAPVYYKSVWVRSNQSGILFSRAPLGKRVVKGEVLGTVTDPITNERSEIVSPYQGRILGMALDQVVLPGFAAYHIGIQTPEAILIEEGLLGSDDDGDDAPGQNNVEQTNEAGTETKPQDSMDDEEE